MKTMQKGFTLIELMIVIAIIGILAAVAIPQYQNYIARSEVQSSLGDIRAQILAVEDYVARYAKAPASATAVEAYTGVDITGSLPSSNSTNWTVTGPAAADTDLIFTVAFIDAAGGGEASAQLRGENYTLKANMTAMAEGTDLSSNGSVAWQVGGTLPVQFQPQIPN